MSDPNNATILVFVKGEPDRILFVIEDWWIRKKRFNYIKPEFLPITTPGGAIDEGEKPLDALKREYFEEMGTKLEDLGIEDLREEIIYTSKFNNSKTLIYKGNAKNIIRFNRDGEKFNNETTGFILPRIDVVKTAVLNGTGEIIDNGIKFKLLPWVLSSLKYMFDNSFIDSD
jgi:8-oxo-dGTP pyrophosphatase MutT (NUDIX family)